MTADIARGKNNKISSYDDLMQHLVYGNPPNQFNDAVSLGNLYSMLAEQRKLFRGGLIGGALLAVLLAFVLPVVYQPSLTVSVPLVGNVSVLTATNAFLGGKKNIPSSPQAVFIHYYDLLRSTKVMADFINESDYLEKLYPDSTQPESVKIASLMEGLEVEIMEPTPEQKGDYIPDPKRVVISIKVNDEEVGVELLNRYASYVNQRLITDLQNDTGEIIRNEINLLSRDVARQREQSRQRRVLTIEKMEKENAKKIAQLQEQISAHLARAKADRMTRIAHTREALEMAKSLNIEYPTTLDAIAQKGQTVNTAITVVDKPASSLYLQGTRYLTTLIKTLTDRQSDEEYLSEINDLREKIQVIENDQELAALKNRESDDPWINDLPEKLAKIDALKNLDPDFSSVMAFNMDEVAIVTDERLKPKRTLIILGGFILSFFFAFFAALIVSSVKRDSSQRENAKL